MLKQVLLLISSTVFLNVVPTFAGDPEKPSYPTVPPTYEVLHASKLIAAATINFPAYKIDWTNGYKVTSPDGSQYVVDSIVQPKCAFYATYVSTDDDGYLGTTQVVSNVHIGEVNFENCK